jgi:hypothetical protein
MTSGPDKMTDPTNDPMKSKTTAINRWRKP